MHTRSLPSPRTLQLLAAIVAFALVSAFVIRTSDAAFTAETSNDDNLFTTGEISLENDLTAPMFGDQSVNPAIQRDAVNLAEDDVRNSCIEITYNGSFDGGQLTAVRLAVSDGAGDLVPFLAFATAQTNDCDGIPTFGDDGELADLTGDTGWTPTTDGETRAFHFRATVLPDAPMAATAEDIDLTWSVSTTNTN